MELQAIEVARTAAEAGPVAFNATLIAQVFNFVILLIFLRVVVWKPLVNAIDKRTEKVTETLTVAETSRKEAEELQVKLTAEYNKAKEEALTIVQRAQKTAEEERSRIVEEAKNESTRMKDSALQEIQMERDKAVAELRNEVASLSMLVAEKIVSKKITDNVQKDLVKKFIDEAGKLPC